MYLKSITDDFDKFSDIMSKVEDTSAGYNSTTRMEGLGTMDTGDLDMDTIVARSKKINDLIDVDALTESIQDAFKPAAKIKDIGGFLNAPALSQEDFVGAHSKAPQVEKNADDAMSDARKLASLNKAHSELKGKHVKLCECVNKFECTMKDIKEGACDSETKAAFEALHKAFVQHVCKYTK